MPQNHFARDDSLRDLAAMDMTEVYRLLTPPDVSLAIPFGDASTEDTELSPDLGQRGAMANAAQAEVWATRGFWNARPGGGEQTIEALMMDVVRDNRSTCDLVVKPRFACGGAGFWGVSITSRVPHIRVFAPTAIQISPLHDVER